MALATVAEVPVATIEDAGADNPAGALAVAVALAVALGAGGSVGVTPAWAQSCWAAAKASVRIQNQSLLLISHRVWRV